MARRLLALNGLAIFTAILYHSSAWGFIAMFWWADRYRQVSVPNFDGIGSPSYYALRFIEAAVIFGIPAFLFVSGFFTAFAAGRTRTTVGWDVLLPRIKNLLIPYLLWSFVFIAAGAVLDNEKVTVLSVVISVLTGQATAAFYFVPVLIQLYLLSPWIIPLAKKRPWLLLAVAGALQLTVALTRYTGIVGAGAPEVLQVLARSWLFPGYIFWFVLGSVIGFHNAAIKPVLIRLRWALLVAALLFLAAGMVEWELLLRASGKDWIGPRETLIDQLYALMFLLSYLAFENLKMPFSKTLNYLGSHSFGVYLVHSLGLIFAAKLVYRFLPGIMSLQLIYQLILYTASLGIPLVLMWMVDHSPLRRYYSTIFG